MKNAGNSFNRFRLLAAAVALISVPCLFAQHSDATLNGPWFGHRTVLDTFAVDNMSYMVFDGNGIVTDMSDFQVGCSGFIGNYSVQPNDSFSLSIYDASCNSLKYTGQLISDYTASFIAGSRIIWRVSNPGALTDSLIGVLNFPSCGQKNIVLSLDNQGMVTSCTGIDGLSGSVYADSGLFMGHFKSTDTSKCSDPTLDWYEFSIAGKYANDSLKGILYFNDTSNNTGTVLLVRRGVVTSVIKKGPAVGPGQIAVRNVKGGIFFITLKNPIDGNLQMQVMDLSGRTVASRVIQCASGSPIAPINLNGQLSRGAYIVRFKEGNYTVQNRIAIQ